ncbi:MAG TPA: heavy metal-binding domain-containing protein [Vicinamibacterales bacterium]|nr:heavy metal-binding domain-containing protein [Vicinamibacterales bacterium]
MKVKVFSTIVAAVVLATAVAAQLPAISWTCPMHPDVLEDRKGTCGICGMDLEAVRLVTMYTCPVHAVIEQGTPGKCRICSRDLVQKTAAVTFTCAGNREISQLEPGTCADGAPMVPRYNARAHGDHNPKHGGTFFMAPDNWHHIEGTYPAAGRFRVYVYDDFSRPLGPSDAKQVRGRVVTKEVFDSKTGATRELASAPLVLARNGSFFEARIEPIALPAKMTAKIAFRSGDKDSRFDFSFPEYSRDLPPSVPPNTSKSTAPAPTAPIASASAVGTATADKPNAPIAIARAPNQLLEDLKARRSEVESLAKQGSLGAIYIPALQAKDLALEIQSQQQGADAESVEASVKQIVLAAYQLDNFGDLGDGEKVQDAYRNFSAAILQLDSLLSGRR